MGLWNRPGQHHHHACSQSIFIFFLNKFSKLFRDFNFWAMFWKGFLNHLRATPNGNSQLSLVCQLTARDMGKLEKTNLFPIWKTVWHLYIDIIVVALKPMVRKFEFNILIFYRCQVKTREIVFFAFYLNTWYSTLML